MKKEKAFNELISRSDINMLIETGISENYRINAIGDTRKVIAEVKNPNSEIQPGRLVQGSGTAIIVNKNL